MVMTSTSFRLATLACFVLLGTKLLATDPGLDAAFVTTIGAGLTPDGYPTFDSGSGATNAVALQSDGKIIAGGNGSKYNKTGALTALKRLNGGGSFDATFNSGGAGLATTTGQPEVNALLRSGGDKVYVGGVFDSYNTTARSGLLRLQSDGTLDPGFNTTGIAAIGAGVRYVLALVEQPDGDLLVGGAFSGVGGVTRNHLARVHSDGTTDLSFNAPSVVGLNSVESIQLLPDGRLYVCGSRTNVAKSRNEPILYRLLADGAIDPSFNILWGDNYGSINQLLALPDGRLLAAGAFAVAPSASIRRIAAFSASGNLDAAFDVKLGSGPNGWPGGELLLQPDGSILVGGIFTAWNGQPRASLARLFADGTLDNALNPAPYLASTALGYGTHLYSFAVQPDGKLVAGGWFSRLSNPALETYNLTRFINEFAVGDPGTLRFVSTALTTAEPATGTTTVALQISRFGGLSGAVSAHLATGGNGGTASSTTDYASQNTTVAWAAGEGGIKTVFVTLLADGIADGSKTFVASLTSATGGAAMPVDTAKITVTVRDVDSLPTIQPHPSSVTLEQGARLSLFLTYDSVLPATVQWERDPDGFGPLDYSDIPAATSVAYNVAAADSALDAGRYRARVTNANGSTTSGAAIVTITTPAGTVVSAFVPPPLSEQINDATQDSLGRFLLASTYSLRRYAADGTADATFTNATFATLPTTALLVLPDTRILVGGFFTTVNGSARPALARFSANGIHDAAYAPPLPPPASGTIFAQCLALGTVGKYYAGFGAGGGLRRYLGTDATDGGFTPPATLGQGNNGTVHAVRELANGRVLVAHQDNPNFSTLTYKLTRLLSTGALDTSFGTGGSVTLSSSLTGFDILPDGRIAIAARFNSLLNPTQQYVGLLQADGSPDPTFVFTGVLNGSATGVTYRDGRLLVWGLFSTVNGAAHGGLVRVNLDGSVDATFAVGAAANDAVQTARYAASGDIFIGGNFTAFKGIARNRAALLIGNAQTGAIGFTPPRVTATEAAGNLTLTLHRYGSATAPLSITYATTADSALADTDFTATAGTVFWAVNETTDKTIQIPLLDDDAIESTKTFRVILSDPTGPVTPAASATVTLVDSDTPVTFSAQPAISSTLISGASLSLSATTTSPSPSPTAYQWLRNGAPIPAATSASYLKNPATAGDGGVYTLLATNAAGAFTSAPALVIVRPQPSRAIPGQATSGRPNFSAINTGFIRRFTGTGLPDVTFTTASVTGGTPEAIAVQPDGQILVGGTFTALAGAPATRLARLNGNGTRDATLVSQVGGSAAFLDLLVLADDRILAAGANFANSATLCLVGSNGSFDSTIATGATVFQIAQAPGGKVIAIRNGTSGALRILRLNAANPLPVPGSNDLDTTFNPGDGPTADARSMTVAADGSIWISGIFTNFDAASPALAGVAHLFGDPADPALLTPPVNTGVSPGQTATLGVGAFGSNLVYQWFKDGTPLSDGGNLSGATTALLSIANASGSDEAAYTATVTGGTPATTLTTLPVRLYVLGAPVVATQPTVPAATLYAGGTLSLSAEIFAAAPVTFQWNKDGVALVNGARVSGATTASLAISSASPSDTGIYTLTATNSLGAVTTTPVFHLVAPDPDARVPGTTTLSVNSDTSVFLPLPDGGVLVAATSSATFSGGFNGTSTPVTSLALLLGDGSYAPIPAVTVNGIINALIRQPDGKILLGGFFSTVNGVTRNCVARLKADFTLDLTFDAGACLVTSSTVGVNGLALDATGRIYVGGQFTSWLGVAKVTNGPARNNLVRLHPGGAFDSTFLTQIIFTVNVIRTSPSGKFLVAGQTTPTPAATGTQLNADGTNDTGFYSMFTAALSGAQAVSDIAYTPDGAAFYATTNATGAVSARRYLATTGAADPTFNGPISNGSSFRLAVQPDGKVFVYSYNTSQRLVRLFSTGAVDPSFNPPAFSASTHALALDPAGRLYVGGNFSGINYQGTTATFILVLEGDLPPLAWGLQPRARSAAAGGNVTFSVATRATAPVAYRWFRNGVLLTNSARISGATTANLTLTGVNGLDEALYTATATTAASGTITSAPGEFIFLGVPEILAAPVATTLEAGQSSTLSVTARGAGTLTYQWFRGTASSPTAAIPGATSAIYTMASPATTDTAYYSVRVTNSLGVSISTPVLIRYEARAGGFASTFPSFSGSVHDVLPLPDGSFVAAGIFANVTAAGAGSSTARRGLAHILADGTIDTAFPVYGSSPDLARLVRDSQGRILLASNVSTTLGGSTRHSFARILADGTLDPAFVGPLTTAANTQLACLAVDSSDRILVGGNFTNLGGVSGINYLARLDATTGARDTAFLPATGGAVNAIHVLADGKLLVGGFFGLKRLNPADGTNDANFSYSGLASITAIVPVPNSTDFIVGNSNGSIDRITASGGRITPFPATGTAANNNFSKLLALPTGNLLAAGSFTTYNSVTAKYIAHLTPNGTAASGIDFGTGFGFTVNSLALDAQGRLLVAGSFSDYRGTAVGRFAIINTVTTPTADPGSPAPDTFTQYLIDAGVPVGQRGTNDDPDGDGSINFDEFTNGTNPNSAASVAFVITASTLDDNVPRSAVLSPAAPTYAPGTAVNVTAPYNTGRTLIGWAPTDFDPLTGYAPAVTTNPLPVTVTRNRRLIGFQGFPIADTLHTTGVFNWRTGGTALWAGVLSVNGPGGGGVARATALNGPGEEAWMETTVTAPGLLTFDWRLDVPAGGSSRLEVYANNSPLGALTSTTAFTSAAFNITSSTGPIPIRYRLTRVATSPSLPNSQETAYLANFAFGPFTAPVLHAPTAVGNTSATLSWTATHGASAYTLQIAADASFTTGLQTIPLGNVTAYSLTGLTKNASYTYRVTALGPVGLGLTATSTSRTFIAAAVDSFTAFLANAGVPAYLRGPHADADNDGLDNLLEYALDLNPNGNGGAFTGTPPTSAQTPTHLTFTYRRVRNDVTYIVETSPDLANPAAWTSVGVTQGTPAGDGTTTARIPILPGARFLRLAVTR